MYAKFGGLGIHNCLLHARVVKLRAETKNTTESLAYRTIATTEQAEGLQVCSMSLATEHEHSKHAQQTLMPLDCK